MEGLNLLGQGHLWYPFKSWGITHPLTAINTETVIHTWIAISALIGIIILSRLALARPSSLSSYVIKLVTKNFTALIEQSVGTFVYRYYAFIASLFLFILSCNWIALIPGVEEPTKNLNTTLALGIIAFLYTQKETIISHGIFAYIKEYLAPLPIPFPLNLLAGITLLPLKLLGELATVISISFRLFGNIFGGAMITAIYQHSIAGSLLYNFLGLFGNIIIAGFFIFFEGFLQAFVFTILSLTNIAMTVRGESEENVV